MRKVNHGDNDSSPDFHPDYREEEIVNESTNAVSVLLNYSTNRQLSNTNTSYDINSEVPYTADLSGIQTGKSSADMGKDKVFKCCICEMEFSQKYSFMRHFKSTLEKTL